MKVVEKAKIDFRLQTTMTLDLCSGCKRTFRRDKLRVLKIVHDVNANEDMGQCYHLQCFARLRYEVGFFDSGEMLLGFHRLKDEDKERVKQILP